MHILDFQFVFLKGNVVITLISIQPMSCIFLTQWHLVLVFITLQNTTAPCGIYSLFLLLFKIQESIPIGCVLPAFLVSGGDMPTPRMQTSPRQIPLMQARLNADPPVGRPSMLVM